MADDDVQTLERALTDDLLEERERFADDKFCRELYRAITRTKLSKPSVADGHVALSFNQAETFVNDIRRQLGHADLTLAQTGEEGDVDSTLQDVLGGRGWRFAPLDTGARDPQHDAADASPPPEHAEQPEWERQAHEEADEELRRRRSS